MSENNTENQLSPLAQVARSYWDHETRGDLEGVLDHFTETATFKAPGHELSGKSQIKSFYQEIMGAYASMHLEMRRVIEAGNLLVVEFGFKYTRHDKSTGYAEGCNVFEMQGNKINVLQCYFNPAEY